MVALRFVSMLALAVWLGGMITIAGVAAPSVFAVLPPTSAASAVGAMLGRFQFVAYGAGGILLVSFAVMAIIGPRPRHFAARLAITGAMLAAMLLSGVWVDGRIAAMRAEIGRPVASLEAGDPRRAAFGRMHGLSTALMLLAVLGGATLLYFDTRDLR